MPRGGSRVGAGRKPKDEQARWLSGYANKKGKPAGGGRPAVHPLAVLAPPVDLPELQRSVWVELAPEAAQARTLTPGKARAFRSLCEAIVVKDGMLAQIETDGWTFQKVTVDGSGQEHTELKAHPLISQWRGMMLRVESQMLRFRLSPVGKEEPIPEEPKDEWAEFDGDRVQ